MVKYCNLCGSEMGSFGKYCSDECRRIMKYRPKSTYKKRRSKKVAPEKEEKIFQLLKANWTNGVIASYLDVEYRSVLDRRNFYGIERYEY